MSDQKSGSRTPSTLTHQRRPRRECPGQPGRQGSPVLVGKSGGEVGAGWPLEAGWESARRRRRRGPGGGRLPVGLARRLPVRGRRLAARRARLLALPVAAVPLRLEGRRGPGRGGHVGGRPVPCRPPLSHGLAGRAGGGGPVLDGVAVLPVAVVEARSVGGVLVFVADVHDQVAVALLASVGFLKGRNETHAFLMGHSSAIL